MKFGNKVCESEFGKKSIQYYKNSLLDFLKRYFLPREVDRYATNNPCTVHAPSAHRQSTVHARSMHSQPNFYLCEKRNFEGGERGLCTIGKI